AQRGERGLQAHRAGDPVEDDVAAAARELGHGLVPDVDLDRRGGPAPFGGDRRDRVADLARVTAGDGDPRDVVLDHLLGEQPQVAAAGGQRLDGVAAAGDDVEGLGADGPGGAEEGERRGHSTARSTSTARSRYASTTPSA